VMLEVKNRWQKTASTHNGAEIMPWQDDPLLR